MLRCVPSAPLGARWCPTCRRSSRGLRARGRPRGSSASSGTAPSTSSQRSAAPARAAGAPRATTVAMSRPGSTSPSRSSRSASTNTTLAPESRKPYSSSSAVHHALSGTTTAPAAAAAQNAIDHSGKLRITIATRSPFATPYRSTRIVGEVRSRPEVLLEGERLVLVDDERRVAPCPARFEDHAQRRGRVLPHSEPVTEHVGVVHLEHRRRRGERGVRLRDRGRRLGCGLGLHGPMMTSRGPRGPRAPTARVFVRRDRRLID